MKVGIIGAGLVGATSAYAIVMSKAASEVVLIDANQKRAIAEAADIQHAVPFTHPTDVYAGTYSDLKDAKIVIIAAGASQKPGETRLELFERNAAILNQIIPQALEAAPNTIFLIATNPVDVITHISYKIASEHGVPSSRVIGSGTTLDTARFRSLLGAHLGVDSQHVHGYVIGEHGDSEVLTWSNIDIGGVPLEDYIEYRKIEFTDKVRQEIDDSVRNAAYKIIEGKGSTYYGIGAAIARIVDAINRDNRAVLTVCGVNEDVEGVKDVTLALPNLISGAGNLCTLPLRLSAREKALLRKSAEIIREKIDEYERK
ncbi:MAG: L-lactate dehydrogenase [Bacillota bacterium]